MKARSKTVTIQDVAEEANCSSPTVSRVLNSNGYAGAKTRKAVLDAVAKLGYVRSARNRLPEAAGKKRQHNRCIEVVGSRRSAWEPAMHFEKGQLDGGDAVVPGDDQIFPTLLHNPVGGFFVKTYYGLMEEARSLGYQVAFRGSSDLSDSKLIREVNGNDRCGVIVLGQDMPELAGFIERCKKPIVLLGMVPDLPADSITVDNHYAMSLAVEHLASRGHRDIGFIRGDTQMSELRERYSCFVYELMTHGLDLRTEWIGRGGSLFAESVSQATEILSQPNRPTAMMGCNDQAALAVLRAAGELGIAVPDELSVVGLDNTDAAAVTTPALTTVAIPFRQMAREAVLRLVSQTEICDADESSRFSACRLLVRPQLVVRDSTSKCPT